MISLEQRYKIQGLKRAIRSWRRGTCDGLGKLFLAVVSLISNTTDRLIFTRVTQTFGNNLMVGWLLFFCFFF